MSDEPAPGEWQGHTKEQPEQCYEPADTGAAHTADEAETPADAPPGEGFTSDGVACDTEAMPSTVDSQEWKKAATPEEAVYEGDGVSAEQTSEAVSGHVLATPRSESAPQQQSFKNSNAAGEGETDADADAAAQQFAGALGHMVGVVHRASQSTSNPRRASHTISLNLAPLPAAAIVKPHTRNVQSVALWEPVEYYPREDSEDEFEMSTCMAPVYEGEGEVNEDESVFKNGKPDCKGEIMSCFDEPNMLYRIVDLKEKTWAFYNDSLHYEMHVQFTFGKHSRLQPLENTTMRRNEEGQYVTEVIVAPTETEMFVQGSIASFTSKLRAVPLTDAYHNARRCITEEQVNTELAAIEQVTCSDNAEDVLQACIENGIPFVDPEFPPCQASLDSGASKPFKPLAWARPQACVPEEMASQVRLFRTEVRPGCVAAGDLGDSWVMCSVASVSEDPARLMGMFRHPEGKLAAQREHAVGAYRVTFNKNGWWRSVLVDSYLPVSAGRLKYAKSAVDPAEIWPAVLEKAYAKLHGSYARICSGDPLHALQDMTGFSTMRFDESLADAKTSNQLFDSLVRGIAAGYTVMCSTPGRGPNDTDRSLNETYANVGLVTGHAYTILDAKHIENKDLRMVKVRNAWGRGVEWNGDWSDDDAKWEANPDIAAACDFQKAADGTFWMPWTAAQKYFNGGGMCFSHKPAYDYRMNCVFTDGVPSAVLEIEVQSPTWFTLVISQDDKRCQTAATEYKPMMISVAAPTKGDIYSVVLNSSADGSHPIADEWTFLQARDISLIQKFEAGKYMVVPRILLEDEVDPVPYVLGMICNKEIGNGDVSVKFKRLDAGNRVFENYSKFEPETMEVEQPVQYQKRAPGAGFAVMQMGDEVM